MQGPIASTTVDELQVAAYSVPTEQPECDGTLCWDSTTVVVVHARAGDLQGLGYSYTHQAAAELINTQLAPHIVGGQAMDVPAAWQRMVQAVRNIGRPGLCSTAIAAVDSALWDLKARLLDVPLVTLLGGARPSVPVYGSGGFTNYSLDQLQAQLREWVQSGISRVKMKVGSDPEMDARRVNAAREAIGAKNALLVDANGAYTRKQALAMAEAFSDAGVCWFEEPVSSDDLAGLRLLRDRAPAGIDIAAGEYGYDLFYFRRMLDAGAVDCLQADVTRCAGITEFLRVGALCQSYGIPLSAHTAPALHLHPCCALPNLRHVEYFHDHVRIERELFAGNITPVQGELHPDPGSPGHGLLLRKDAAERYRTASHKEG